MANDFTIGEIARRSGVSLSTVSRALADSSLVKASTRERVLQVARELNYVPNLLARGTRTKKSMAVGFLVSDISNVALAAVAQAATERLYEHNYTLLLANSGGVLSREVEHIYQFRRRLIDGLLISTWHEQEISLLDALKTLRRPVVSFDRELGAPCDMVMADHAGGMEEAVAYLITLNHRKIGIITASEDISPGRSRISGYRTAFARSGIVPDGRLIRTGDLSEQFGLEATQHLLELTDPPTAIIAGGNQINVGVMRALKMLNLKVPDDLSLVSCDDTPLTELFIPSITTIARNLPQAGSISADLLIQKMREEVDSSEFRRVILPTRLRLGGSCGFAQ